MTVLFPLPSCGGECPVDVPSMTQWCRNVSGATPRRGGVAPSYNQGDPSTAPGPLVTPGWTDTYRQDALWPACSACTFGNGTDGALACRDGRGSKRHRCVQWRMRPCCETILQRQKCHWRHSCHCTAALGKTANQSAGFDERKRQQVSQAREWKNQ